MYIIFSDMLYYRFKYLFNSDFIFKYPLIKVQRSKRFEIHIRNVEKKIYTLQSTTRLIADENQ